MYVQRTKLTSIKLMVIQLKVKFINMLELIITTDGYKMAVNHNRDLDVVEFSVNEGETDFVISLEEWDSLKNYIDYKIQLNEENKDKAL